MRPNGLTFEISMMSPEEEEVWTHRRPSSPSCDILSGNRNSVILGAKSSSTLSSTLAGNSNC